LREGTRKQDLNDLKSNRRLWLHAGHYPVEVNQTEVVCRFATPLTATAWIVEYSSFSTKPGEVEVVRAARWASAGSRTHTCLTRSRRSVSHVSA